MPISYIFSFGLINKVKGYDGQLSYNGKLIIVNLGN